MFKFSLARDVSEWTSNIKGDIFGGVLTTFSVLPEVIGFTIVAGVAPILGIYTSIIFLILLSFLGGRPAMASAGAGSMAVVVVSLIRSYDLSYLFAAVLLAGALQLILGILKVGNLTKFIPKSVVAGFVDSLAIIIFKSQITSFLGNLGVGTSGVVMTVVLIVCAIAVIYLFPRITKAFPPALFALVLITLAWLSFNAISGGSVTIARISDLGNLAPEMPSVRFPSVPFTFETLKIVAPYSASLAIVGLLETLLTNGVVDDMTETRSNKNRECRGQGIANLVCGLIGAMPGCAMIGQATANVSSGGRGRLSTFVSGAGLVLLLLFGSAVLSAVPLAALVAVMITVSVSTFDWGNLKEILQSFKNREKETIMSSLVTILTIAMVLLTDNLAFGTMAGLLLHGIFKLLQGKVTLSPQETDLE